jgi:enamine deaminase RidA (YjgF/YER057c/UK114 family)
LPYHHSRILVREKKSRQGTAIRLGRLLHIAAREWRQVSAGGGRWQQEIRRKPRSEKEPQVMTHNPNSSIVRSNPPELGTPPGYSQIVDVTAHRIIFISGQTALDRDGNLIGKNDFAAQAVQVFRNLAVALRERGCDASNLVKMTVFLTDMNNLGSYREARNRFFASVAPPAAPAVTLLEVSKLYGPDFLIEIEAIAAV